MLEFNTRTSFETTIVSNLISDLEVCRSANPEVHVLLSGGSTPGPIYTKLNADYPFIGNLKIGLVDERFVENSHPKSNELLLHSCFPAQQIIGMIQVPSDREENLNRVKQNYTPFIERTDLVVLGMGADGHTASLFPSDEASDIALHSSAKTLFNTQALEEPKKRITVSYALLKEARFIYLLISGAKKKEVLLDTKATLPIHKLLADRKDLKIYYLHHD